MKPLTHAVNEFAPSLFTYRHAFARQFAADEAREKLVYALFLNAMLDVDRTKSE
jgi:hypothetical protein